MGTNCTWTPAPFNLDPRGILDPLKVSLSRITGASTDEQQKVVIWGLEEPQHSLHDVLGCRQTASPWKQDVWLAEKCLHCVQKGAPHLHYMVHSVGSTSVNLFINHGQLRCLFSPSVWGFVPILQLNVCRWRTNILVSGSHKLLPTMSKQTLSSLCSSVVSGHPSLRAMLDLHSSPVEFSQRSC